MKVSVVKKDQQQSFDVQDGERILYAGLRQGLGLPHECATGTCGSCKAALISGEIRSLWNEAPGAKSCKSSKNEFLMCQSAALGDCELSFRGKLEPAAPDRERPDYHVGRIFGSILLTPDVMQFWVRFEQPVSFRPGQFVVLEVDELSGGRAYSMVNHDQNPLDLEFIVKRFPGGGFSEWMFSGSREGAVARIFGPLGLATLDADETRDLICITGGSGIAGIMALLGRAVEAGYFERNRGELFFGVRTWQDFFFREKLQRLHEMSAGQLEITVAFSDAEVPEEAAEQVRGIDFQHGFITPVAMQQIGSEYDNQVFYLAGPPVMVDDAIRQLVMELGSPVDAIRYDKFG